MAGCKYRVVGNWCSCHPETCCCNDYAVVDRCGEKVTTTFSRSEGEIYIAGLVAMENKNKKLNKKLRKLQSR